VVWRGDFPGKDPANWKLTPGLSLGRHGGGNDLRFHPAPDVALTKDDTGSFDAVAIGSGDRANPLDLTIANKFFMWKDRSIGTGVSAVSTPYILSDLTNLTDNCLQDADVGCPVDINVNNGWYIDLEGTGEKNLSSPLILGGSIFFTTYLPPGNTGTQCGPAEGGGRLYGVKLQTAVAVANNDTTNDTDGGGELQKEDRMDPLSSGGIPSEVVALPVAGLSGGMLPILRPDLSVDLTVTKMNWKTFWYQSLD
jgi:type IV pilus assembly protein PilY1